MTTTEQRSMTQTAAATWAAEIASDPNVVYLDTETTGLGELAEIVDIAIVAQDGTVLLDTLVCPINPIPTEATAVHGITDADVVTAPLWVEVAETVRELLTGKTVVVYNADYDRGIVEKVTASAGLDPIADVNWQCAMKAYSDFDGTVGKYGKLKWHRLDDACSRFGIDAGGHRAVTDTQAARLVVRAMGGAA